MPASRPPPRAPRESPAREAPFTIRFILNGGDSNTGVRKMEGQVVARFLVDYPFRPGTVRAILDTLVAQGGAYEPHLMRRLSEDSLRRIMGFSARRPPSSEGGGSAVRHQADLLSVGHGAFPVTQ